jgi:two-component system chemotaxis response regulator CheB
MRKQIKVLIIDDSALVREILEKGLSCEPEIKVVGKAPDVYIARDKIVFKKPDVLTLDIEMPRMDGIEFLKRLMPQYPLPVVVVSAMSAPGARVTLDALEYGAVDFVLKPSVKVGSGLSGMIKELIKKIKIAAQADVSHWKRVVSSSPLKKQPESKVLVGTTDKVIAIGASTGGTVAITQIINTLPPDIPGIVIVQHMPPVFTRLFAEKLNHTSRLEVKEAETGDRIVTGRVLVAPGGYHMEVNRSGGNYLVSCREGNNVNGHCPSVDVLFESVAKNAGPNSIGIILTGMGKDGAKAMLSMRRAGARTFAQNEESSVVFGMPKEAYECGGAERYVHLDKVALELIKTVNRMK